MNEKEVSEEEKANKKNMQFARDLFKSWDVDGDGTISENEIIKPLVALGLAPDLKFAKKLCGSLEPKNSSRENDEPIELKINDFLNIFKVDLCSDKLM